MAFDFAALDYSSPTDNKYAYKLEGYDDDWHYSNADRNYAVYTNITDGEYIFIVKASNSDGVWNEEGVSLKIIINTPFWKQLWFILLMITAGISCILLFIRYRTRTLSKHAQYLELRVVERTSQLNEKSKQLENELNRRVTFTRVLVHELKTPLTPILTASEFLKNTMEDNSSKEIIETIFLGASTLDKRIDELMDISRGEIGMLKFNFKDRNVTMIIKEVKQYMSYMFLQKNQSFVVEMPDYIPKISINRERIRQVLINILTNASKFTQKYGHIILRVTYDSENITIEIEDDGIGIPLDKQDDLFTFYGTFENRGFPNKGMGIGLALSKIIVDLHGGKIWGKNNQNGKGSTFGFSLPYNKRH
jgi:signal transduction histidine kinase